MLRLLSIAALLCATAFAQTDATVLGTVSDATGGMIPTAKVTLTSTSNGTQQVSETDVNGNYQFLKVRIGDFTLTAEKNGFKTARSESFQVTVNATQRVNLSMQVGDTSESVSVSGAAALLETDSSERSQVIYTREIVNLPLNGRSYADLTLLSPGVRRSMLQDPNSLTSREASYNVNGQRAESNNFRLDGIDNNAYGTSNQGFSNQTVQITPDAVNEYRVETNNFSAEYGHASGAVINASTRSGTNQLHGSVWEFLRNTDFNAVGFFKPTLGIKPVYQQNQFGAAAGGPIIRNKLFIFADYEGQRRKIASVQFASLPTLDMAAGRLGFPVRNPLTGALYADGVIPASDILPAAANVLKNLPAPNNIINPSNPVGNNYQSLPASTQDENKGDFRIDYYQNSKLTAFTRYSHRVSDLFIPGNIPGPAGGNNNGNVHIFNQQIDPGFDYTFNATSVLEARLGFTWTEGGKTPIGLGQPSLLTGIPNIPTDPLVAGSLYSQAVNGFSQFGRQTSNPQFQNPYVINPHVNYSKFLGRHTIKVGYEFLWVATTIDDFNPAFGLENYNGQFSKPTGGTAPTYIYGIADYLLGLRDHYELNNLAVVDYRQYMHFGYVQDDFKVNNRLTVNMGVRYELTSPQWLTSNKIANFDPSSKSLVFAKSGGLYDRSLQDTDFGDWAPRFGLAWRPIEKTVVRGGYGVSYQQFNRLGGENLLAYNGPNIIDAQIDQLPTQGLCSFNSAPTSCFRPTSLGFPDNFANASFFNTLTAQARYIPRNNPTGFVQSWHVSVQREIFKNIVLDVAYVGNKGADLMILADYNQAAFQQPGATLTLQQRRPVSNFGFIEVAYGAGKSRYDALQVKLEKRYSNGIYLLNSFTLSKANDNASGHLETANGDNSRVNYYNLDSEYGRSSYDQRVNDTFSMVVETPYGKGRRFGSNANPFMQGVFGGWQISAINTMTSGLPINLTYSPTALQTVSTAPNYRPDLNGNPVTPEGQRTIFNYLNPATVTIPAEVNRPWGTAPRNGAEGYGFFQLDMGLHKEFHLGSEARRLQLRGEAFNLLNQTNFQAANSNRSSSSFGSITSTFSQRVLQVAAKIIF